MSNLATTTYHSSSSRSPFNFIAPSSPTPRSARTHNNPKTGFHPSPKASPSASRSPSRLNNITLMSLAPDNPLVPITPTPKKLRRRRLHPDQRPSASDVPDTNAVLEDPSDDEDMLFDLLGVTSPPPKEVGSSQSLSVDSSKAGVLPVTKAQLDISKRKGGRRGGKRGDGGNTEAPQSEPEKQVEKEKGKGRAQEQPSHPSPAIGHEEERGIMSEGDLLGSKSTPTRRNRSKPPKAMSSSALPVSALTQSRPISVKKGKGAASIQPLDESAVQPEDAFETASLSQSLPAGGLLLTSSARGPKLKKNRAGEDEGAVWDMPDESTLMGTQELTWQQKLQAHATDTPNRNAKSTPSDRRKTRTQTQHHPLMSMPSIRPPHARRQSLDDIPFTKPKPSSTIPVSHFDSTIPFHTGFNVHRAPQTPAKLSTSKAPGTALPVLPGDFPRMHPRAKDIVESAGGVDGGFKYAGPTFHNSPHGHSLPKPDLEDF